ncbi:BaeS Signal transduction histidine kinase [Paracoccaceae bacterium]|jgi:two-component system sensor histidine kinase TctE
MRPYSLRRRLLLWLLLATILLGLIALIDTWREALRTAEGVSDRVLFGSALAIAERVSVDEAGGLEVDIPYSSLEMLTSTAQDKVFYRVDGPIGTFLTGYQDLAVIAAPAGGVAFANGTHDGVSIRSATVNREISTGAASIRFTVTVAESIRARSALAQAILVRSALRLALLVFGVAVLVWVAVTVALRPLKRLGDAIANRSPDDLHAVTADTPEEVEPLVLAINQFMDRLKTALDGLRNFTGNASHQLRTPLAVVRTQLALIDRSTGHEATAVASDKAKLSLERAERVLSHLLLLARVDASASAAVLAPVDIAELAKEVTAEMVPAAITQDIDLGYEGCDHAMVAADPVLLAELLRNLLANAISYSGSGAVVTVRLARIGDRIVLAIEDNGPGLSDAQMLVAAQLGRGAPRPSPHLAKSQTNGMGLGLAVAVEIAKLFKANLRLERPGSGTGLLASVEFSELPE